MIQCPNKYKYIYIQHNVNRAEIDKYEKEKIIKLKKFCVFCIYSKMLNGPSSWENIMKCYKRCIYTHKMFFNKYFQY